FHIDAYIAIDNKTVFGASASNMGGVRAGNERLCWYTSRIHTCATKLVAFNNGDRHARSCKPRSQRRACLAGPDDDCIEMLRHYAPPLRKIDELAHDEPDTQATFCQRTDAALAGRSTSDELRLMVGDHRSSFRPTGTGFCLFHRWKGEKSPAFQACQGP